MLSLINACSVLLVVVLSLSNLHVRAQLTEASDRDTTDVLERDFVNTIAGIQYDPNFVKERLRNADQPISMFGYYRFFGYGRNMTQAYPGLSPFERAFSVGDGYREPMLSLNVVGRPSPNTTFGSELYVFTPYLGDYTIGNDFTTNLGINFYGNFRTKHGNYGIRAGGIHWYNQSPFTIGLFQVLDRFTIFDRTPWEGVSNTDRYDAYYKTGVATPGDLRWNNQAFQGLIINGAALPGDFMFDLYWGKTQPQSGLPGGLTNPFETIPPTLNAGNIPNYGGIAGTSRVLPSFITGGKLGRSFDNNRHQLTYNLLHNTTYLDSISDQRRIYQIHTLSLNLSLGDLRLEGELGGGSFESPTYDRKWGEALMLRLYIPEEISYFPIDVQVYQISKNFFNQSGEIFTNSNPEILENIGLLPGAVGAGGQLSQVNQLVHNRRGVNANVRTSFGKFKFNVGWGLAQEIDPLATQLNFLHRVNGLALSRIYNPFPEGATGPVIFGPYGRLVSFFRGVSETVQTTDLDAGDATPLNRKFFNALDLQAKYSTTLFEKPFYIFYLGTLASAEAKASLLPSMHDDSYLFVQAHEFDIYYELVQKFILTGYYGIENARGGRFTNWDLDTQLPRDQLGTAIGIGFDWTVAENAGLYVRHRWMNYQDRSFELDQFRGRELTVELKVFF